MSRIFINYRREETGAVAGRLEDSLAATFGRDNLFRDVNALRRRLGRDFAQEIEQVVTSCDAFLVLLGKRWIEILNERSKGEEEDFVVFEIEIALRRRDLLVIPILVEGAQMPKRRELPPALHPLLRCQALVLTDRHWEHDVDDLVETLEELLGSETAPDVQGQLPAQPPVTSALPSLAQLLPGAWRVQITNLFGFAGQLDIHFYANGQFQGQLAIPTGISGVGGQWQLPQNNSLVLQGQQSNGWQTIPYFVAIQFNQIQPNQLTGVSGAGEHLTAWRVS